MNKAILVSLMFCGLSACGHASIAPPTDILETPITPTISISPETQKPIPTLEPSQILDTPTPPLPTSDVDFDELIEQKIGLRHEFQKDISDQEMETRYWINVRVEFDPDKEIASIEGVARIRFTNQWQEAINEIVLMLWPNNEQYQAEMTTGPLLINDVQVEVEFSESNLFIRAPLVPELQAGATIDLTLPFSVQASGSIGEIGLKRFGISYSIFAAPTFYPLVPRMVDGEWQTISASAAGDTTNSDIAFYDVTITAPSEFDLITSGVEVDDASPTSAYQTKTFVSGPMRDFAFVIGPFEKLERHVEGVDLNGWVLPGHLEDGEVMMDAASQQFSLLSDLLGPYPYPELDLADVPGGFGGIEYPGLVFIGTLGEFDIVDPTVHEVTHQWFYGLIGNDQLIEPWLDEGAARYGQVLYYENFVGSSRASALLNYDRVQIWGHPDRTTPIGRAVTEYETPEDYVLFVYSKGALFFDQLRSTIGDKNFFEFLRAYYAKNKYGFVTAEDFQDTAESICSCDLDELFNVWVFEGGEMPVPGG